MAYGIAKRIIIRRGSVHSGTEPKIDHVYCADYGLFSTSLLAKRHLVMIWHPELVGCDDLHVKRVCRYWVNGNDSDYKIIKLRC